MTIDISIEGQGFYSITGESKRGRHWIDRNVQGSEGGAACTDDTRLAVEIAGGATNEGLRVSVNDYLYLSGGIRGKKVA